LKFSLNVKYIILIYFKNVSQLHNGICGRPQTAIEKPLAYCNATRRALNIKYSKNISILSNVAGFIYNYNQIHKYRLKVIRRGFFWMRL
jgi:hypothetical protein